MTTDLEYEAALERYHADIRRARQDAAPGGAAQTKSTPESHGPCECCRRVARLQGHVVDDEVLRLCYACVCEAVEDEPGF